MPIRGNWYLTVKAVREYMEICGLSGPLESDNPEFVRAERELVEISQTAKPADTPLTDSGGVIYRVWVESPKGRLRLELTVMPWTRPEGDASQLVRVRLKDQQGRRGRDRGQP